ncbi:MAG: C-type lectin domain-containing protein [Myxococcota bacterium]|nr:C-type lectin domain-containing protein [Myxococcota bacterium]
MSTSILLDRLSMTLCVIQGKSVSGGCTIRASFACFLLLILSGCPSTASEQQCNPQTQSGCANSGQACALDTTGAPTCLPPIGQISEGGRCTGVEPGVDPTTLDGAELCAPGLGCIRYLGIARCLRFCDPGRIDSDDACTQTTVNPEHQHALSGFSSCSITITDRPEIGACALPCRFADNVDSACPSNTRCAVPFGGRTAICVAAGQRGIGDSCGAGCDCVENAQCVPDLSGFVCRRKVNASGQCQADEFTQNLFGTSDPLSDDGLATYSVCTACRTLGYRGLSYCPDQARCLSQNGQLASFSASDASRLTDFLFEQSAQIGPVLVGAYRSDDGQWRWSQNETLIDNQLWADGLPVDGVACVGLSADGFLRGLEDCQHAVLCDQSYRPSCDAGE